MIKLLYNIIILNVNKFNIKNNVNSLFNIAHDHNKQPFPEETVDEQNISSHEM